MLRYSPDFKSALPLKIATPGNQYVSLSSKITDGNMSIKKGNPKQVLLNRKNFLKNAGIDPDFLAIMAPYHGTKIIEISLKDLGTASQNLTTSFDADILITSTPNIFLFTVTGDCLPITIFDPKNNLTALIHAGWIGLDLDILKIAITHLKKKYGSNPEDLLVKIAPSIGPCCYKLTLAPELNLADKNPQAYKTLIKNWKKFLILQPTGKYSINLWHFAETILTKFGIPLENIENPQICTYHNNEYFSHRKSIEKSTAKDYRFATLAGIKS